jgi:hypothetical protein
VDGNVAAPIMADDDQRRLESIRNDRLHRLRLLEKRQAIEGFRVDPSVLVEIETTRRELGMVEDAITHPASAEMAEEMGAGARWLATDRKLDMVVKLLSERMDRMEEHSLERYEHQESQRDASAAFIRLALVILGFGLGIALLLIAAIIGGRFL